MQCPGHVGQLKNLVERRRRIVERREHLESSASSRPRRREPTGEAQGAPARIRQSITGCARVIARPRGTRATAARKCGRDRRSPPRRSRQSLEGSGPRRRRLPQPDRPGGHSQRVMQLCELFNRHRARLEQPPEIGREIGDGRLEDNPSARFVHVAKARQRLGAGVGRRVTQERSQVPIGFNLPGAHERGGFGTPASRWSPRTDATAASWSSVRGSAAGVIAPALSGSIASLSARLVRAPTVAALPWIRSAGSPPATPRSRL